MKLESQQYLMLTLLNLEQFNVGPGDIYRHVEGTERLLYAATKIAELYRRKSLTFAIDNIRNRIRYGIKKELLELAQLKGVGRVRARALFEQGFFKLKDLELTDATVLARIKVIGKKLAEDIHTQLSRKARYSKSLS